MPTNTTSSVTQQVGRVARPDRDQFAHLALWTDAALTAMPYFASIILAFRPVNAPGLGTFAVDDKMRLYIDFDAVVPKGEDWCTDSLIHEAGHVWNNHSARAKEIGVPTTFIARRLWNYGSDFAINDDLVEVGCVTLSDMLSKPHIGEELHLTAEHYYSVMKKAADQHMASQCQQCGNHTDQSTGKADQQHKDNQAQQQKSEPSDAYKQGFEDGKNAQQANEPDSGSGEQAEADQQPSEDSQQGQDSTESQTGDSGPADQQGESGDSGEPGPADQPGDGSADQQGDSGEPGPSTEPGPASQPGDSSTGTDGAGANPGSGIQPSGTGEPMTGAQAATAAGLSGQEAADYAAGYEAGLNADQGDQPGDSGQPKQPMMGDPGGECPDCGGTMPQFSGCGSGAGGTPNPYELGSDDLGGYAPPASEAEQDDIRMKVAADIQEYVAKGRGTVPGNMVAESAIVLAPPVVPWQRLLSARLRRAYGKQIGKLRQTYTRTNRRRHNVRLGGTGEKVIYPGRYQPRMRILCIRDTSGSMGSDDLNMVGNEIVGIAKSLHVKGEYLQVMDVDYVVHKVTPYRDVRSLAEVHGRGGTSMTAGIVAATEMDPKPDIVVVLTDGGTDWPQTPPPFPVIACLIGHYAEGSKEYVPDWMPSVVVDEKAKKAA